MKKTIAAVVVTYNRKELLVHCLEAIFNQSHSVNAIYIVDNKSNDGTPEYLLENKIIGQFPTLDSKINEKHSEIRTLENGNKIIINYIRKFENDGGAGGFYEGMKSAFEADFDWLWFMDDDGVPDKNQIEFLLKANKDSKIDYLNALVVNIERNNLLAFGLNGYKSIEDIKEDRFIIGEANPFNGTFISRRIIQKIGFIKKEMFIWGDENEYLKRVKKNNFEVATVIEAKHRHPKIKGVTKKIIPFMKSPSVVIKPANLAHIYYRNIGFLNKEYGSKKSVIYTFMIYSLFFLVRFNFKLLFSFAINFRKGINNDFS